MELFRKPLERLIVITTFLTPFAYAEPGLINWIGVPPPCGFLFIFGWFAPVYFSPYSLIWWPDLIIYSTMAGSWLFLGLFLVVVLHRISNGEPYPFSTKLIVIIVFILQILIPPFLLQFLWSYDYITPLPIPSTIAILYFANRYKKRE